VNHCGAAGLSTQQPVRRAADSQQNWSMPSFSATPTPSLSYAAQLTEGGLFAIMEEPGFEGIVAKAAS